jgi:unsaturated chondroitin disaccharide hydrolase
MKRLFQWIGLLVIASSSAQAKDLQRWSHALDFAGQQLEKTAGKIPVTESPKATQSDGTWSLIQSTAPAEWTQGFFPGSLWYMFEQTGLEKWKSFAARWTAPLEGQKLNTTTHDLGFKLVPSFGHGFELTADDPYRQVLLTAAKSLATRFRPKAGIICMGDWNPNWKMPAVIDTMMDIELLMWAARNGGDPAWEAMAVSHATTTLRDLVRPDGSTYHVADYDPSSGQLRWQGTFQGYSDKSTWTRGQVWAMYGFARMYRYTKRPEFLDASRRTTELFLSRLPPDLIAPWDFDAPNQQLKDSSAASSGAAALLELADVETDPARAARYRSVAETILDTLSGPSYLAEGSSSDGILLHGVGNYPANQEIDVSLVYGDYYFIEALLAARKESQATTPVTPAPDAGAPAIDAGTPPTTDAGSPGVDAGTQASSTDGGSPAPTSQGGAAPTTQSGCHSVGLSGALGIVVAGLMLRSRRTRR